MYHPVGARERDVSTRLIKPTLPNMDINEILNLVNNWNSVWEIDAGILIFDEGIAQFLLVDEQSHVKFFAALILKKASLRCRLVNDEPKDMLEEAENIFRIVNNEELTPTDSKKIDFLKNILTKRGYRFAE
ncbi:unnamed protein product [Dracunculus medinensis]|uniref:DUF5071 domain-containing protein n=1 Tax=Dracunculus medinensis TaxID=318479 RepID=A0A0N4U9L9_DRAME|nr:unnamed protein product [Dracunculus medinensis]